MTLRATALHCKFCFDVIIAKLNDTQPPSDPFPPELETALFVTWSISEKLDEAKEESFQLRGCIGCFEKSSINEALATYAKYAAFNDTRFAAIRREEVPYLKVGVSLLVNFEPDKSPFDFELGKHGVIIQYKTYSATYLPEVATETGWSKEQLLTSLLRKAGYKFKVDQKILEQCKITTYESSKFSLTYAEYIQMSSIRNQ